MKAKIETEVTKLQEVISESFDEIDANKQKLQEYEKEADAKMLELDNLLN